MSDDLTRSIPKHFIVTPQPDGSTVVERTASDRRSGVGPSLLISVPLFGMFVYRAIPYFRTFEGDPPPITDPMVMICIGAVLTLLGQTATLLWQARGREAWQVSPNHLRWRERLFGLSRERCYLDGTLVLQRRFWVNGTVTEYRLFVRAGGRRTRSMYTTFNLRVIRHLADYLAAQTGWPVEQGWT